MTETKKGERVKNRGQESYKKQNSTIQDFFKETTKTLSVKDQKNARY